MDIQNALKENGRASCNEDGYVFVDEYGVLRWYDTVNDRVDSPAELNEILNSDWLPYHKERQIRPEKAGELWKENDEMNNIHQEIDKILTLVENSYSLTVPKSIDPTNEKLTILSEINEDGRRDAKKVKRRDDDYDIQRDDAYDIQVETGRKINED